MRTTTRRGHRGSVGLVAVLAAVALLAPLAACSDDDGTTTTGGTTTTASPTTSGSDDGPDEGTTSTDETTPGGEGGIDPMLDAGLDPISGEPEVGGTAYLTEVDAARHEGYDRVVFHFEDHRPGFEVGYVEPPVRADGSGEVVPVDGVAVLQVRMNPASVVDLSSSTVREVYTGPDRLAPDTPTVAEVVQVGDFEAYATWAIGVRDRVPFRVLTLDDPARLVVDVANH